MKYITNCMKKITTTEFINRATDIHGNRYDYRYTNYINHRSKVKIICPIHGVFEQIPTNHISGHGCKNCGILRILGLRSL